MISVCSSGYPGYPGYPGGNAYPAAGGPAHYTSQTPVTTVGELSPVPQFYNPPVKTHNSCEFCHKPHYFILDSFTL